MSPAKSLEKVKNSVQNKEGVKKKMQEKNFDESSELEYWKKKALELESKQSQQHSYVQISPNDMVEVVSLCYDKLNLNTKNHGEGNRYSFEYYGETKNIMFSEIAQIKETQRNFARKGYFFVNNIDAVRLLGLEEDYKKILSQEKINEILENSPDAEKLFKSANQGQQSIIANMMINMIVEGKSFDMNLIRKISEISGIDINKRVIGQQESLKRNELEE